MSWPKRWLLTLIFFVAVPHARANTRHALVIGNDSYPGNELHNARNDAKAIATMLHGVGYVTTLVLDANRLTLSDKIDAFVDTLIPGDTALLYYAGHGFQLDGENFLVPTDFQVISPLVAKSEGYSLSSVLERFTSHGATTQIVILDACRNNPFLGGRSLKGGWASLGTSAGSFLAFGTSPGSTASDDPQDGHGLFTKDLLNHLTTSDQDIEEMFRLVREDVIRDSDGKQVPWVASSLIGAYHVRPELDVTNRLLPDISDRRVELKNVYDRSIAQRPPIVGSHRTVVDESTELSNAMDLVRGQRLDEAVDVLQNILRLNPVCAAALNLLGLIFHRDRRDVEALSAFDRVLAADPANAGAATYKCAIEQVSARSEALPDCRSVVTDHPSAETYLLLAAAEHSAGDDDSANRNIAESILLAPSDIAYELRGVINLPNR